MRIIFVHSCTMVWNTSKPSKAKQMANDSKAIVFDEANPNCTRGRKKSLEAFRSAEPRQTVAAPHTRKKPTTREANRLTNTLKLGAGLEDFRSDSARGLISKSSVEEVVSFARSGSGKAGAKPRRRKWSIVGRKQANKGASQGSGRNRSASVPETVPLNPLYKPGTSSFTSSATVRTIESRKRVSKRLLKPVINAVNVVAAANAFVDGLKKNKADGDDDDEDVPASSVPAPVLPPMRAKIRNEDPRAIEGDQNLDNDDGHSDEPDDTHDDAPGDTITDARLARIQSMRAKIRTRGASTVEYSTYFDAVNWIKTNVKATKDF